MISNGVDTEDGHCSQSFFTSSVVLLCPSISPYLDPTSSVNKTFIIIGEDFLVEKKINLERHSGLQDSDCSENQSDCSIFVQTSLPYRMTIMNLMYLILSGGSFSSSSSSCFLLLVWDDDDAPMSWVLLVLAS
jgi:hypothetical protein